MQEMPAGGGVAAQIGLFPAPLPSPGLDDEIYAVARPAGVFTGDFYFTHRHGSCLCFTLGDVAGKGLRAAVVMAMIQEELERRVAECALVRCDPATTMQRLHSFLRPILPRNRFATIVAGHLADDGELTLANAGHCPPLVVRAGGTVERIASTGPVAGLLPRAAWSAFRTHLEPGDLLLLYSDGVTEARSPAGFEFGEETLVEIARGLRGRSPRRAAEAILAAIDVHTQGRRDDDLTLVAVRRSGPG